MLCSLSLTLHIKRLLPLRFTSSFARLQFALRFYTSAWIFCRFHTRMQKKKSVFDKLPRMQWWVNTFWCHFRGLHVYIHVCECGRVYPCSHLYAGFGETNGIWEDNMCMLSPVAAESLMNIYIFKRTKRERVQAGLKRIILYIAISSACMYLP